MIMAGDKYRKQEVGYLFEETGDVPGDVKFHMEYYLNNIPNYLRGILNDVNFGKEIDKVANFIASHSGTDLVFSGSGTSFHLALAAKSAFESISGLPVLAIDPFSISYYSSPVIKSGSILMILSHSGRNKIATEAAIRFRDAGGSVIAMTSIPSSQLARVSGLELLVPGGRESSLPKTKSYLCALLVINLLSIKLARLNGYKSIQELNKLEDDLWKIPGIIENTTSNLKEKIKNLAYEWAGKKEYFFIGSGPNYVTAVEIALKFKETNYEGAEGEDIEEEAHGPYLEMEKDSVLVAIAPKGPSEQRALDLVKAANLIGATTLTVAYDKSMVCGESKECFRVEGEISEIFTPMTYVMPLLFLNYYIAIAKGINPDLARNDVPEYSKSTTIVFPPGSH